ncbi:unnamed protein product [Ambrosiozyma monospora]|uniref:Unnamed protein product n=1 Tax=Ambrosiozyma monospora TaxID=43982 RepID=A0ACB5T5K1_AMBMO|nr:unnamed protein product [Ambrosiozyma monospora]
MKFDDIDDVIDNTRQNTNNNEYATSLPENNTYTATPTEGSPSGPSSSNVPPVSIKKELRSMASSESCKSSLSSPNSVDIASDTSPLSDVISPSLRLSHTSTSSSTTVKTPSGKIGKPKKDRSSHNIIEKKYRTNINAKILELRDAVPTLRAVNESERISLDELEGLTPAVKLNKASILSKATEYIKHLEAKNMALINEVMALRSAMNMNMNMGMNPMMQPPPPPHSGMIQPRIVRMGPPMMGQVPIQQRPIQMPNGQYMMQSNPAGMMPQQQQQQQPQPQPQSQQFQQQQQQPQQQQQFNQMPAESSEFMQNQNQYSSEQQPQQQQQYQQPQPQQQQSSQYQSPQMANNGNMPLSNKLLMAGMTTVVGTQLLNGGEYDNGNGFKGLSFLPLQQLFPILFSSGSNGVPYASSVFLMFKMTLFFGGLFLLGQPYLMSWLGSLNDETDPKKKSKSVTSSINGSAAGKTKVKVKDEDSVDSWQLVSEFVHLIGVKTGLVQQELNEKLTGISEFNKRFQKLVIDRVQNFNSASNNSFKFNNSINNSNTTDNNKDSIWKQFIRLFIVMFTIDERLIDSLKSDDVIQFQFNRLILTKLVYMKLGPILGGALLLQRLIDSLMLSVVKTVNTLHLDGSSSSKKNLEVDQ